MLHVKTLLAAFALAIASVATAAPAVAQGTKIVVVDQARVLNESRAGKDIRTKIDTIENEMKRELEPTAQTLETMGKSLEAKTANMTPEAMRSDEALRTEAQNYQTKLVELSQQRDKRATELAITERKATIAFSQALKPVLDQVMSENSAQIMMSASDVMIALPATDVTDTVIQKLDAQSPTIAVTRERLPEQAQQ